MKQKRIRILAIAPYEGMRELMLDIVKEFDDIEMNVFVGDLGQGLLLAKYNFYNDYDVIVSRGGTASMMKEQLDLPIIEIDISPLDILRAMKIGENMSESYAVIGFPNITQNAQMISQLMDSEISVYSINSEDEVESILYKLERNGPHTILGDMISYTTALKLGLTPVLIKSGEECIRKAFQQARQLYYTHQRLREENRFLRSLIWKHINYTLVFDEDGTIFFSTLENNNKEIVRYLREERGRELKDGDCHIIKQINNVRYSIRMTKEYFAQKEYTVYYFTESKVSLPDIRRGIRYLGAPDAEREYKNSIYGIIGLEESLCKEIEHLNRNEQPLLIYGEDGTCKEQAAKYIYALSSWKNRPMVLVDCFMMNKKAWDYLMENHNSPLTLDKCTIFIKNIDMLSAVQRKQLLANLLEMNVCKHNRVIFSSICNGQKSVTEAGKDLLETLCCATLYLPALREDKERISALINQYLNYVNMRLQKRLIRIEPDAVGALREFGWSHNYTQFQRVMEELAAADRDGLIHREDVESALKSEAVIATVSNKAEDANIRIDLNQTLDRINRDIILKILEEEGGNRTSTAKRLGISRSTLWRLLKNE